MELGGGSTWVRVRGRHSPFSRVKSRPFFSGIALFGLARMCLSLIAFGVSSFSV